jgi:hypothetical protein
MGNKMVPKNKWGAPSAQILVCFIPGGFTANLINNI